METIKRFGVFLKESWNEVRHQVTYPSREDVKKTSIVVIVTSATFAAYLSICDVIMALAVGKFFELVR